MEGPQATLQVDEGIFLHHNVNVFLRFHVCFDLHIGLLVSKSLLCWPTLMIIRTRVDISFQLGYHEMKVILLGFIQGKIHLLKYLGFFLGSFMIDKSVPTKGDGSYYVTLLFGLGVIDLIHVKELSNILQYKNPLLKELGKPIGRDF